MADIATLQAEIREVRRLLKNLDEFAVNGFKMNSEDILANKNAIRSLESGMKTFDKRVADLEKKQKR